MHKKPKSVWKNRTIKAKGENELFFRLEVRTEKKLATTTNTALVSINWTKGSDHETRWRERKSVRRRINLLAYRYYTFNPIPTGGGGGGTLCPPPQVHFLKYLRNALSYGLETFWKFKWMKLKNKNLFFNRLRPPLVTIATFKVDECFWKAHFGSFHANAYQNSMFFATPIKNGRTVVCCENLG